MTRNENGDNGTPPAKITYFIVATVCMVIGAVLFGITFAGLGIYTLIASMVSELAAVSFLNAQKKTGYYFKLCLVERIISYAVMIAGLAFVLMIIVYKA